MALASLARPAFAQGASVAQRNGAAAPTSAPDTSPAAFVAARELFREATEDADAGRYEVALEKFQRVARIRDSAAVRFDIANCEERLGRIASALASYELAVQLAQREPRSDDLVTRARAGAESLRPRAPRLTLSPGAAPPRDLSVSLDGAALPFASLGVALPVDPGAHVVEADAPGRRQRRWMVNVAEGESQTLSIALGEGPEPGRALATTGATGDEPAATPGATTAATADDYAGASWWTARRGVGVAAIGVGAAAAVVSTVFVARHNGAVSDLHDACAAGGCPESRRNDLVTTRDAAVRDETIAVVTGVLAGAAIATGAVLVLWPTPRTSVRASPGGLSVQGAF